MKAIRIAAAALAVALVASAAMRRKHRRRTSSARTSVERDRRVAEIGADAQRHLAKLQSQALWDLRSFAMEMAGSDPEAQYVVAKIMATFAASQGSQRQGWT